MSRFRRVLWPRAVPDEEPGRLTVFALAAVVVGGLTGVMAASFRVALDLLSEARNELILWAQNSPVLGMLAVVLVCAVAAAGAAALVHRVEPHAEGSGIPRVEAVVEGRTPPGRPMILPVKYVGGLLAMGAGLALGREGPSVQMGGNIGVIVSRVARRNLYDLRILVAAGAAAGLATAFNAPIAGGVFVLEELVKRFDARTTLATLLASGAGFASAHVLTGDATGVFRTAPLGQPRLLDMPAVLLLGVLAGLAGVAYNWLVMRSLAFVDVSRFPRELRAGLIGAIVGVVGFYAPDLIGGGDLLTQNALLGGGSITLVIVVLLARTVLGVISYAAGTPGGLFAPMLVLGSHLGLLIGLLTQAFAPGWGPQPAALALIGMAAFFTATVRAPVTGVVLAIELTGGTSQLPPMLGACAVAMLVTMLLRSEPIYDALTSRAARAARQNATESP